MVKGKEGEESSDVVKDMLINERNDIFAMAQAIYDASLKINAESVTSFKPKYDRLTLLEQKFEDVVSRIRKHNSTITNPRERLDTTNAYTSFVELIDLAKGKFLDVMRAVHQSKSGESTSEDSTTNQAASSSGFSRSCLPRIQLPKFDGNIENWLEFNSLFSSLVDNDSSLTPIQKFQYLRSSLSSNALAVISGFSLEADNYKLAYDSLKRRYQNERRLASSYLSKIFDFVPITKPTSGWLQKYLNVHENSVNALLSLGIVDLGDFILLQLALNNLDSATRSDFEDLQSSHIIPSYKDLMYFVTERRRKEELLPSSISSKSQNNVSKTHSWSNRRNDSLPRSSSLVTTVQLPPVVSATPSGSRKKGRSTPKISDCTGSRRGQQGIRISKEEELPKKGELNLVKPLLCWNCRSGQHRHQDCTEPRRKFCYRCGKSGFLVSNCPLCSPGNKKGSQN